MDYEEMLLQISDILRAHNRHHMDTPDHGQAVKLIREIVTPKGKWLKSSNMSKRSYQRLCSNCKHIVYFCGDGNYPNCPYCLADMIGEENGTDL